MSTSLVHVLTVIGKGAAQVEDACEDILRRRVERDPESFGSLDWSETDHKTIDGFCTSLIDAAHDLPVLYYAQYLDSWGVADSRFSLLRWRDSERRHICGSSFGLVFYPSEFCQDLLAQIKTFHRRSLTRKNPEYRWFLDEIQEALQSAQWLDAPFLVVSISRCLGPSRHDDEIRTALDLSINVTDRRSH